MATITNDWSDNSNYAGSNAVSNIDNRIRTQAQDLYERMKNGGHKWTNGTKTTQEGIHKVSTDNFVSGEFSVYDSAETTKLLTLTDTACAINKATTITGNSTVTGDLAVSGALTVGGSAIGSGKFPMTFIIDCAYRSYLQASVPANGTLTRIDVVANVGVFGSSTISVTRYSAPTWSTNQLTALGSGSSIASLTLNSNNLGVRSTGLSQALVASDIIKVTIGGAQFTDGGFLAITLYITVS